MSIIISKPAGVPFEKEKVYGEVIFSKPVAINYVYADGKKLHYAKSLRLKSDIWSKLSALKRYPVLIHIYEDKDFSKLKRSNWCPVFLNKSIAIIGAGDVGDAIGDCRLDKNYLKFLIKKYLKPMVQQMPNFLSLPAGQWMIEKLLSFEAAMITINSKGKINIFNESFGDKINDLWVFDSFTNAVQYQKHFFS